MERLIDGEGARLALLTVIPARSARWRSAESKKGTPMSDLPHIAKTQIAKFPEVTALVVTDDAGSLLESSGDIDSEAIGAVHVVTMQALTRCGNALGLGALERLTVTGPKRACLIAVYDHEVLGIYVDPTKPIGAFEKKLDSALRR
jgi:predicted regulator of Ras-like GTPase activity (Roadblock/LC7/MglB family)